MTSRLITCRGSLESASLYLESRQSFGRASPISYGAINRQNAHLLYPISRGRVPYKYRIRRHSRILSKHSDCIHIMDYPFARNLLAPLQTSSAGPVSVPIFTQLRKTSSELIDFAPLVIDKCGTPAIEHPNVIKSKVKLTLIGNTSRFKSKLFASQSTFFLIVYNINYFL